LGKTERRTRFGDELSFVFAKKCKNIEFIVDRLKEKEYNK
jgi:hypothetical protein